VVASDEPGLLAALVGQRGDLAGVKALLAEGGIKVAIGGLNVAALQPREVFGPALTLGAAAVILAHNHPSGDPTPSPEDLAVTRHLQEAGRLLGVEVLDHLVVSAERFRSLREGGAL
jgi:DNA repair protein RadC